MRDFYEVLGVARDASDTEVSEFSRFSDFSDFSFSSSKIKKAYRKLAIKLHPDKNPDDPEASQKFEELSRAYQTLIDPEKRVLYNQTGQEGPQPQFRDASDIFASFFGPGGFGEGDDFGGGLFGSLFGRSFGQRPQQQPRVKGDNVLYRLAIPLSLFYSGGVRKLKLTRDATCSTCNGRGTAAPEVDLTCAACKGRGMVMVREQPRPGYVIERSSPCSACQGSGEAVDDALRCGDCQGKRLVSVEQIIEVPIEAGAAEQTRIVFPGQGSDLPGVSGSAGDLIVELGLKLEPECPFHRVGDDLVYELHLSLKDALLGFKKQISHLDNHLVTVESQQVIQPRSDAHVVIPHEGMPVAGGNGRGDLYVRFEIHFPEVVSPEARALLENALPDDGDAIHAQRTTEAPSSGESLFAKLKNVLKRRKM